MIKAGNRVKLSKQGIRKWNSSKRVLPHNPVDTEGSVCEGSGNFGMMYSVQWPNGSNSYDEGDIELVSLESTIEAWLAEDKAQEEALVKQAAGALKLQETFKVDQSKLSWGQRNPKGVGIRQASIRMPDWGR